MTLLKYLVILFIIYSPTNNICQTLPDSVKTKLSNLTDIEKVQYLGKLCWDLRDKETDLSIKFGKKAIEIANQNKFNNQYAKLNNYVGVAYLHYKFDIKNSLYYFHQALDQSLKYNDSLQLGYTYNNLGDVYYLNGNTALAHEYTLKSLEIFIAIKNVTGQAYCYSNLGTIERIRKNYQKSLNYFNKVLELKNKYNDKYGIAWNTWAIGNTYFADNNFTKAFEYYQKSFELYEIVNSENGMANSLNGIADVFYKQNNYKLALKNYTNSYKLNKIKQNILGQIDNNLGLALVYSKYKKRKIGEEKLKEALRLSKELGLTVKIRDTYETYSKFYSNLEDYKSASESLTMFLAFHDSVISLQRFQTLQEIQKNLDIKNQYDAINFDLKLKHKEELFLIVIIILLLVFGSVILIKFRSTKILKDKLNALNSTKDKLFTIISHDLKSPFNSILAFSSMLQDEFDSISNSEKLEGIKEIQNSTTKIYKLLENLLDWSRLQNKSLQVNIEKLEIKEIISQNCNLYKMTAKNKKIELNNNDDGSKEYVFGDEYMLNSVIRNLLNNAIKFTGKFGSITISTYNKSKDKLIIEIKDTGLGIEEEKLKYIFTNNNFSSLQGTNNESGTGLGLVICKEFVDLMDGKISVISKINVGTTFFIELKTVAN